jgi:hypothetical protein
MRPLQDGHSNDGLPHGTQLQQASGGPPLHQQDHQPQELLPQQQFNQMRRPYGQFSFAGRGRAQSSVHSPVRPMMMWPPTPRPGAAAAGFAPSVFDPRAASL